MDSSEEVTVETSYDLTVSRVVVETADAHSVSFAVPEGAEHTFAYKPGQFLTLGVPSDQTGVAARSYSLSSSPHDGGPMTVTVKRTPAGYASNWICDNLRVGSTIRVLAPSGNFTPHDVDHDLLLFAGGSGITPIMSIIRTVLSCGSGSMALFYANRDKHSVIFAAELSRLASEHPGRLRVLHWLESERGLPTAQHLRTFAEPYTAYDAFVCGPGPFMDLTTDVLRQLGFPRERRQQEVFVSIQGDPFGDERKQVDAAARAHQANTRIVVEMDGDTYDYDDWAPTTKLLDHLESKGVKAPYSCREGVCSTCEFTLLEGEVELLKNDVLDEDDLEEGIRLACQALPASDVVRAKYR
jgi:3-ketosteroid 9alpha-monooxygenase subunit B